MDRDEQLTMEMTVGILTDELEQVGKIRAEILDKQRELLDSDTKMEALEDAFKARIASIEEKLKEQPELVI
jgi:predicted  nucleic acid-binding Zn-ribbon protein